jgi:hypothetical protein
MNGWLTAMTHGHLAQADLLTNPQELACAFLQPRPGWADSDRLIIWLLIQRFRATGVINLHKLHNAIHPRSQAIRQRCSPECDHDLSRAAVDLSTSDLHNLAD